MKKNVPISRSPDVKKLDVKKLDVDKPDAGKPRPAMTLSGWQDRPLDSSAMSADVHDAIEWRRLCAARRAQRSLLEDFVARETPPPF